MGRAVGARPNILLIVTDQQRADHAGFAGNAVVRTPHLDALAARGTVFDNAWVANPVCMPNRSTIMTGRMPSAHGVIFNDRSLEWGAATFVRAFRSAGWRTGLLGKSHLQHGMSRNAVFPEHAEPVVADPWPTGWDEVEDFERYVDRWPEDPEDFYGFDTIRLAIDHGARMSGHHLRWALDRGARLEDVLVPYSIEAPALERSGRWWQVYQPPYDPELHSTSFVRDETIRFVRQAAGESSPWLAMASFPDPHHPFTPPGEWYHRHRPEDMPLPVTLGDPLASAPAYLRRVRATSPAQQRGWVGVTGAGDDPVLVQECLAANYGTIEMIDDAVGSILAAVDELGQTDDTIVVFTSDHGDMMGEHGLLLKGFMPYRGTQAVPLVMAGPGVLTGRSSALVGTIDLAQTLLDAAGLPEHVGMQGRSLMPLLEGSETSGHEWLLIEDDVADAIAAAGHIPARSRTLVGADGLKYTRWSSGEDLLFDLVADPLEAHDLSTDSPGRRADAVDRLAGALVESSDAARGAPVAPG